jgi:uncharacterized protein
MKFKNIELPIDQIKEFCGSCGVALCAKRWQIIEFALFGSVLRDDFRPDSDIDMLVTFAPTTQRGLTETLQMRDELQSIFDRNVDLIVRAAISSSYPQGVERSANWLRRKNILESAQTIYATRSRISH